ncbi:hypothetical protein ACIQD3_12360 [Peribacillus loiseleuriae]
MAEVIIINDKNTRRRSDEKAKGVKKGEYKKSKKHIPLKQKMQSFMMEK